MPGSGPSVSSGQEESPAPGLPVLKGKTANHRDAFLGGLLQDSAKNPSSPLVLELLGPCAWAAVKATPQVNGPQVLGSELRFSPPKEVLCRFLPSLAASLLVLVRRGLAEARMGGRLEGCLFFL